MFKWNFIYLEVAQRSTDQQIIFGVSEVDIVNILQKLRQDMRVQGIDLNFDVITNSSTMEELLNFILDCFLIDEQTNEIKLSMIHLKKRLIERKALEEKFIITGGRFVQIQDGQDPELA